MTDPLPPETSSEAARIRRSLAIVAVGFGVGMLATVASAIGGGSGREGLGLLLVLTAVGMGVGGFHAAVFMLVDQFRGRRSTWRRLVLVIGLMLGALVMLGMAGGLGATE